MNELIDKYWPFVKVLLLPYLILMFLMVYPMDYQITTVGGLTDVSRTVEVHYNEDKVVEGSISSVYVVTLEHPTFFEFIAAYFSPYCDFAELSGSQLYYTPEDKAAIAYLSHSTSVDASVFVAYQTLAGTNPDISVVYEIKTLVYAKAEYLSAYSEVTLGDEFLYVTGDGGRIAHAVNGSAPEGCDLSEEDDNFCSTSEGWSAVTKDADTYVVTFRNAEGTEYSVSLTRDAEYGNFGLYLQQFYLMDKDLITPVFEELPSNTGGSSGGFLQTLYVYNCLVEEDITHGLKIAGTGTIHYDGTLGDIAGTKQKIAAAYLAKVDVFFIDNEINDWAEAMAACEELGIEDTSWIIQVDTFQECLDYLNALGD